MPISGAGFLATGSLCLAALCGAACADVRRPAEDSTAPATSSVTRPDSGDRAVPAMLNRTLPFRYPAALYARKVQGNVVLRLYVDSTGRVVRDSTTVAESSGYPPLDSAATAGARALTFGPAIHDGRPMGAIVRFPVYFRHPGAPPLPGDSADPARTGVRR